VLSSNITLITCVYALANFHAGVNDGTKNVSYTRDEIDYNFDLSNSVRDYMIGFGIGGDLLHINRHKIYMQGTVGIGSSEQYEDGITLSPGGACATHARSRRKGE
jgi:hypothetical protein